MPIHISRYTCLATALTCGTPLLHAQDDLLLLLASDSMEVVHTSASFKSTRVINGHSLENTAHGVLDFRIGHRFGFLSNGVQELFGLDQATIRLGFDYGATDRLMLGFGRSSFEKTLDGFAKYKLLRQCDQGCSMPFTLAVVAAASATTMPANQVPWYFEGIEDHLTHRLAYSFQAVIGRKFTEGLTLQLSPGVVHRNLVKTAADRNDLINLGIGGRAKLSKRVTINAEYFYVLPDQGPRPAYHNSVAVGFDIETGGHVFQLHFTNSTAMYERGFITETVGDFARGDIHFGFNISRVFTLHDPKAKAWRKAQEAGSKP
ncbi:MAG: hypothetical protein IT230_10835 [Flavobacteriales bacterium]|nr:hypothetical protein [Flavobacteriales bacterium]